MKEYFDKYETNFKRFIEISFLQIQRNYKIENIKHAYRLKNRAKNCQKRYVVLRLYNLEICK